MNAALVLGRVFGTGFASYNTSRCVEHKLVIRLFVVEVESDCVGALLLDADAKQLMQLDA